MGTIKNQRKKKRRNAMIRLTLMLVLLISLLILAVVVAVKAKDKNVSGQKEFQTTEANQDSQSDFGPNSEIDSEAASETEGDSEALDSEDTEAEAEEESEEASEAESEADSEADSEPVADNTGEQLPAKVYGNWDLSTLDATMTGFGNNPDQQDEKGIPQGVYWYDSQWGQYGVDFISERTDEKVIYLTMDCGFDNPDTELILDILKEKNVKATFFVTSMFYDARPDLIERMINEGHRIGSHSIHHYDMTTLDIETQTNEIMDVVNKLKADYNYDCRLFRFPQGKFSAQSLALVDNLGLKSVFWSFAYGDYTDPQPDPTESLQHCCKYIHPGGIYLLHASSSTNRQIIGAWIDNVRAQGYEFAGVYPVDK